MKWKSEDKYRSVWNDLLTICTERNLRLKPSIIHVDFEQAMHNVLKEIFPHAQLKCCRFHLAQAWWRKIQSVGLSNEYRNAESQLGKWLKCFFGLHFVDAVEVEDIFVDLMSVAPNDEKCIKFADYFVENYVTNDSKFPPSMWAEIPSDEKMTNNAAESYHAHLNEQIVFSPSNNFCFHGCCAETSVC